MGYHDYSRDHILSADGLPDIVGSSDPAFRGSPMHWNPEQLLVASLSACHKLWFLHLAAEAGLVITSYRDEAEGLMTEAANGGQFELVTLRPGVTVEDGDVTKIPAIHEAAHRCCFVARSVSFPVQVKPRLQDLHLALQQN